MFVLDAIKQYAGSERIALVHRERSLSFAELETRSEAFAAYLLERYGDDRSPVVLYGHKDVDILPCLYGALKAGCAYVPVDLVVPPERAAEIVADVAPRLVVNFSDATLDVAAEVLPAGELEGILRQSPAVEVPRETWVSGDDVVYILFTSGSTGKPKGVPITADNLLSFHEGLLPYMDEAGGVALNQISYSFDVSGCSIYVALSLGLTLFTVDKEMVADVGAMFRALKDSGLTQWVSTPSFAELCARSELFNEELLPDVRSFLFCGEVLTHKLCDTLAERFPRARVLNTYGPTEATVLVSAVWVDEAMRADARPIPIGFPIEGTEMRLVDAGGAEVPEDDITGELLILGRSVGPGYHNRPEQTAKNFFVDGKTGQRGYRTGDVCYRRAGNYYYTGRADNQIKLNGYRVEIEDIESNLTALNNVSRAAVLPVWADTEHSRVQYLTAFVLLEREDGLTPLKRATALKKQAAERLPAYMIPRKFIAVDAFPLNTNGKIDKKVLAQCLEKGSGA